jgi:hypothetical protein
MVVAKENLHIEDISKHLCHGTFYSVAAPGKEIIFGRPEKSGIAYLKETNLCIGSSNFSKKTNGDS